MKIIYYFFWKDFRFCLSLWIEIHHYRIRKEISSIFFLQNSKRILRVISNNSIQLYKKLSKVRISKENVKLLNSDVACWLNQRPKEYVDHCINRINWTRWIKTVHLTRSTKLNSEIFNRTVHCPLSMNHGPN